MKNFDVTLYGNLVLDRVYSVGTYTEGASNTCRRSYTSPGALVNVLKALYGINSKLKVNIMSQVGPDDNGRYIQKWLANYREMHGTPSKIEVGTIRPPTSEAVIVCEEDRQQRSSIVRWGACSHLNNQEWQPSRWTHILYLDKLPHIKFLENIEKGGTISIDLCSNKHTAQDRERMLAVLRQVDYVFASEEEGMSLADAPTAHAAALSLGKKCKGTAIIHHPAGSFYSAGDKVTVVENEELIQVPANVLGAGDNFAAAFIAARLRESGASPETLEESLLVAHQHATHYIKNNTPPKEW